jgi:hypothetical protein
MAEAEPEPEMEEQEVVGQPEPEPAGPGWGRMTCDYEPSFDKAIPAKVIKSAPPSRSRCTSLLW